MKCPRCKINERKDGQSYCPSCDKIVYHEYYLKNRVSHIKSANKVVAENKQRLETYFQGKRCIDCNETDWILFDFDHRNPKTKKKDVTILLFNGCCWKTILKEIKKCDIVCVNCHRRRTAKRSRSYRFIYLQKKGKV